MASRKNEEMKQRLLQERDMLLRKKEAIENQIAGIERAIALISEDGDVEAPPSQGRRVATKGIVLDLLSDVGTTGLNAQSAVDMAANRGIDLDKASVSSLLSRLKKDEVVVYDGDRYRLKKFADLSFRAGPQHAAHPRMTPLFDVPSAEDDNNSFGKAAIFN
ncbi:hypothetical protein FF100_33570 [Methylobacterium terricola]|uniref:Uncharacterized protein n=1 Tax=Methylobacterium terricola TaxID=2583531 RepID=A0A5C4L7V0_9HYPH|nr:hypothetical protein [Methylobacterium terricola]TNC07103.1 hypothetical protein FF100_33570 [Methylobacterium terricola]